MLRRGAEKAGRASNNASTQSPLGALKPTIRPKARKRCLTLHAFALLQLAACLRKCKVKQVGFPPSPPKPLQATVTANQSRTPVKQAAWQQRAFSTPASSAQRRCALPPLCVCHLLLLRPQRHAQDTLHFRNDLAARIRRLRHAHLTGR